MLWTRSHPFLSCHNPSPGFQAHRSFSLQETLQEQAKQKECRVIPPLGFRNFLLQHNIISSCSCTRCAAQIGSALPAGAPATNPQVAKGFVRNVTRRGEAAGGIPPTIQDQASRSAGSIGAASLHRRTAATLTFHFSLITYSLRTTLEPTRIPVLRKPGHHALLGSSRCRLCCRLQ